MFTIFLSLGSNLGRREEMLSRAQNLLGASGVKITKTSRVYKTEPWGDAGTDWFLNCVVEGETELTPTELLRHTQKIEKKLGRDSRHDKSRHKSRDKGRGKSTSQKYTSRTIDIDILFYGDVIINEPNLTIPHPEIPNRNFVLKPLAEIAPDLAHPQSKKTMRQLLKECADASIVMPHEQPASNSRAQKACDSVSYRYFKRCTQGQFRACDNGTFLY